MENAKIEKLGLKTSNRFDLRHPDGTVFNQDHAVVHELDNWVAYQMKRGLLIDEDAQEEKIEVAEKPAAKTAAKTAAK